MNDVYTFFKSGNTLYGTVFYIRNNWVKKISNLGSIGYYLAIDDKINRIKDLEGGIWLMSNGDIHYRFSPNATVHATKNISKINTLFSNFLGCNFELTLKIPKNRTPIEELQKLNNENTWSLYIDQLLLVESEVFNPYQTEEFYQNKADNLFYRNTFIPSYYLNMNVPEPKAIQWNEIDPSQPKGDYYIHNSPKKSITLQYLYHITNYNEKRFYYLLNWIASFFQDLKKKSNVTLILYGNKNSGIDILFDYILSPLFGSNYSFKITNDIIPSIQENSKTTNNKLFYNFHNLKEIDSTKEKALSALFPSRKSFSQLLITIEEPELSYVNKNDTEYTLFHTTTTLNQIHIPDWYNDSANTNLTKSKLINAIENDLENFTKILKLHTSTTIIETFKNDDRNVIHASQEDKLVLFVQAIKQKELDYFKKIKSDENLFETLEKDFEKNLIRQPNLIKYFAKIYPKENINSTRTLMPLLKKIDNKLFDIENIQMGAGGKKYFKLSSF